MSYPGLESPDDPMLPKIAAVEQENNCFHKRVVMLGILGEIAELDISDGRSEADRQDAKQALLNRALEHALIHDYCGLSVDSDSFSLTACQKPQANCPLERKTALAELPTVQIE